MADDDTHTSPGAPGHGGVRLEVDLDPGAWITTGQMLVGDGEAMILRGIAALIDRAASTADGQAPAEDGAPGGSRTMSPQAEGADRFPEFLIEQVAALLGVGDHLAWDHLSDVALLRGRHPVAWAAMLEGRARAWDVRRVARMAADAGLPLAAAHRVDARLAPAWDTLAWPRIRRRAAGLIKTADPALAARTAEAARRTRGVTIRHFGDGTSTVFARISTPAAADLDHTRPWRKGRKGQTRASNLAPLSRHEHRAKHHGGWTVIQDPPGTLTWTSPAGDRYQVTRGYTHRLPRRLPRRL